MIQAANDRIDSALNLNLVITDRNVLDYLAQFSDEEIRTEKALEALKIGVIAIQSASPTLDTSVVESQFTEMELRMRESINEFQGTVKADLKKYFEENDGVVPRSMDGIFGDRGMLAATFEQFFDPEDGRLGRLMQAHVGPESTFGKSIDPANKHGVIAVLEAKVQELVEAKLEEVLKEFSLDDNDSAMSRLQGLLTESFEKINHALGHIVGHEKEAKKGHVKGMRFEKELYDEFFSPICLAADDEPQLVRGTPGHLTPCKTGDLLSTLGDTTGAPGVNIVIEVKDSDVKLGDARKELQEAKVNRKAAIGIFVWCKGREPGEVGDFRRIGDDFYVTVDRDDLRAGKPLLYFEAAYRIARAMAVATVRKDSANEINLAAIEDHVEALGTWSEKLAVMCTKAKTIQNSGRLIEDSAADLKAELDRRVSEVLEILRQGSEE